jgi:hypothetical protein
MKTLNSTILKVEHFATIRGEDITEVKIRLKGHIEEKYLQIQVNELDVEKTPREKIKAEIFRLEEDKDNAKSTAYYNICGNKIEALELALTYLD